MEESEKRGKKGIEDKKEKKRHKGIQEKVKKKEEEKSNRE